MEKSALQSGKLMIRYPLFGALAQLVAHNTGSVGVRSSNLLCSTDPGSLINQGFQNFLLSSENRVKNRKKSKMSTECLPDFKIEKANQIFFYPGQNGQ